ncbi:MAG: hypothetical protein ACXWXV_12255 [Aeromicrobium sp.]
MKQWLKLTAIVVFLIVDIVAAAFVIRNVNQRPASEGSSLAVPTETPSATTSATAEPSSEGPAGLIVSGNLVARFTKGSCDDPSRTSLELSTDQAANFTEIALPLDAKPDANGDRNAAVTSIVDVTLKSPTVLSIIGTDTDCRTYSYATKDGGEDWKRAGAAGSWFVDKDQVAAPGGMVDPECEALSLWPISDRNARVGCKDGQIRGTDDAGETWVGLGFLEGLTAVTFSTIRDGIGTADDGACASRSYSTGSAGNEWEPLGCIDKNKRAAAIGGAAELFAALVDGDVFVSTDQGQNWKKS